MFLSNTNPESRPDAKCSSEIMCKLKIEKNKLHVELGAQTTEKSMHVFDSLRSSLSGGISGFTRRETDKKKVQLQNYTGHKAFGVLIDD